MYWVPMEITGSNEGTLKDPKFSLLDWFQKKEIPRLEAVAREVYALTGKKSIIRYQMDGAGPHIGKELLKELDQEFNNRNWILKFQPSQSPLTNVKDFCTVPAMSKAAMSLPEPGGSIATSDSTMVLIMNQRKHLIQQV